MGMGLLVAINTEVDFSVEYRYGCQSFTHVALKTLWLGHYFQ